MRRDDRQRLDDISAAIDAIREHLTRGELADGLDFLALLPDPSHPTGKAICLKGKAAPDIVYYCNYVELCGWGRNLAPLYTFGASVPGAYLPDLENAGCILFWGYNPSVARLAHATSTVAAVARGAKLIVVDPRKAGLAAPATGCGYGQAPTRRSPCPSRT